MKNVDKVEIDNRPVLQINIYIFKNSRIESMKFNICPKRKKKCLLVYKVYVWPYYLSPLRNIPGQTSESLIYGNIRAFFVERVSEGRCFKYFKYFLTYTLYFFIT